MDTEKIAREIVRDSLKPEVSETFTITYGKSVRIEVPLTSLPFYRDCLKQIIFECQKQLLDSEPARLKGRHIGIVLGVYQATWRRYVSAWKRQLKNGGSDR